VADEVRNGRGTTSATREIQSIISALQNDVKNVISSMIKRQQCKKRHLDCTTLTRPSSLLKTKTRHSWPMSEQVLPLRKNSLHRLHITDSMHQITAMIQTSADGAKNNRKNCY
jgi:methyl-accepting chemotaxis protein